MRWKCQMWKYRSIQLKGIPVSPTQFSLIRNVLKILGFLFAHFRISTITFATVLKVTAVWRILSQCFHSIMYWKNHSSLTYMWDIQMLFFGDKIYDAILYSIMLPMWRKHLSWSLEMVKNITCIHIMAIYLDLLKGKLALSFFAHKWVDMYTQKVSKTKFDMQKVPAHLLIDVAVGSELIIWNIAFIITVMISIADDLQILLTWIVRNCQVFLT